MGEDLAEELRKFHIPDFSNWTNHDSYRVAFEKLVKDLAAAHQTTPPDADRTRLLCYCFIDTER
jgi:hypothetical protein